LLAVFTILTFLALGREIALRWWPSGAAGPYERATFAAVLGLSLWLASLWLLALFHVMTPALLLARTAAALIVAVVLALHRRPILARPRWRDHGLWLSLAPWAVFAAWKGWLLPPVNHDALAYHLPKAVLFARAGGFDSLSYLDARIATIPANYEMLLAEVIALQQRDTITEWISLLFHLLFAAAAAAVAERWWGKRAALAGFLAAGVPVALLHSSTHKNDLMIAFFIVAGLVAAGRFITTADERALLVTVLAFAAATGTKPQAAATALALAPAIVRRAGPRRTAWAAGLAVVAFLALGGVVFIRNFAESRAAMGMQASGEAVVQYGDWANLWQGPYVILAAPFATSPIELPVPWESRPWFWRRYELFFSHLGIPFALCAAVLPIAIVILRRKASPEAFIVTAATLAAFAVMLPVVFEPHGLYAISLPRYALFIVPIVFAWAVAVLPARVVLAGALLAAISFAAYAVDITRRDVFAPWAYVMWVLDHRDTRAVPFDPWRAAEVADRRAGPRDRIAFDAAFGSWIHPAFGVELARPVDFIRAGGPLPIRDDTQWVIIDRGWNKVWNHPEFRDLSQARDFLLRGTTVPADDRILRQLRGDHRFKLVYFDPKNYQAIFQRVRGKN
jgi:hypothetical protein